MQDGQRWRKRGSVVPCGGLYALLAVHLEQGSLSVVRVENLVSMVLV
jgi:hypothetical protein